MLRTTGGLCRCTVRRSIRLYLEREWTAAGIPQYTPHDLRRTFARLSRRAKTDLEAIQKQMDHAGISTTARYLELTPEGQINGAEALDGNLAAE